MPRARNVDSRVTEDGEEEESFVSPLVVPRTPQRFYFKFGKPVDTSAGTLNPKPSTLNPRAVQV